MKQDETIRSQKERQARGPEYDRLEVLIGKWINVGKTEPMNDEPPPRKGRARAGHFHRGRFTS